MGHFHWIYKSPSQYPSLLLHIYLCWSNLNKTLYTHIVTVMMNGKTLLLILGSLSLFSLIISTPFTNFAFGQAQPTIGNNTSSSSSTSSLDSSNLGKKLEKVSSLSNIVGISLVDGIKVSGINIGDTDLSVTLRYQTAGGNVSNIGNASSSSLPVTIIATKLPVSNITQLLSMVEAMRNMATTATSNANPMGSILGQPGSSNPAMESNAVQILSLLRNIQIGIASVVNANWTLPQTVSMGLFGGLRDMGAASTTTTTTAPTDLIMVIVVPFLGETNLPTLQLK
jgi:hypothetical protein